MTFEIRRLSVADADAFRTLRLAALKDVPKAFSESFAEAAAADDEFWRSRVAENYILGGFEQGTLMGMAQVDRYASAATQHRAWLTGVYVMPQMRGTGMSRALMDEALNDAKSQGVLQIHLGVGVFNEAARKLYEKLGFEAYGTQPRGLFAEGEYVDEILMVRFLDDEETK
jgi:RimJ/RimL family protein N-acetyltransferase